MSSSEHSRSWTDMSTAVIRLGSVLDLPHPNMSTEDFTRSARKAFPHACGKFRVLVCFVF